MALDHMSTRMMEACLHWQNAVPHVQCHTNYPSHLQDEVLSQQVLRHLTIHHKTHGGGDLQHSTAQHGTQTEQAEHQTAQMHTMRT
jgi:hypothetical protein